MSAPNVPAFAPLPKTHYFLTVSRGTGMRTFAVRVFVVRGLACLLVMLGLIGAASTGYILVHDDVVVSLMARQTQMQYAYEDRLDALRDQLQRQTMRDTADRASIGSRLDDLLARESKLETRAQTVAGLVDLTGTIGSRQAAFPFGPASTDALAQHLGALAPLTRMQPALPNLPTAALGYAAPSAAPSPNALGVGLKPHPEAETIAPEKPPVALPQSLSAIQSIGLPLPTRLSLAAASLDQVERIQVASLLKIGSAARQETSMLEATLDDVGLSSDRFHHPMPAAEGGPFVPLPADRDTPFGQTMADLRDTLAKAAHLRGAVAAIPLADPLPGPPEVTSPFGARLDPFLGRPALHTGVDLRENSGTEVTATAGGRVVFAGEAGGYGNMVEIDHGNGLATRYAHMQEILVTEGQTIEKDGIVGRVGSTGRATGPHLHYEIRVDNEPVDPLRYLNVGLRLAGSPGH